MFSKEREHYCLGKGFFSLLSLLFWKSQFAASITWSNAVFDSSQLRALVCFVLRLCECIKGEGRTWDTRKGLAETLSEVKGYRHPLSQGFCFWRSPRNRILSLTSGSESKCWSLSPAKRTRPAQRAHGTFPLRGGSLSLVAGTDGKPRHNVVRLPLDLLWSITLVHLEADNYRKR